MELGLTNKLTLATGIVPEEKVSSDPFFCWTASFSDNALYCIHDQSGAGFIYTGEITDLGRIVSDGIRACFCSMSVLPELINNYMTTLGTVQYRKPRDRRQSARIGNFCSRKEPCTPALGYYLFRLQSHRIYDGKCRRTVSDRLDLEMRRHFHTQKVFYGEHEAARYAARPLPSSRIYAGYQFYAKLTYEGYSSDQCFRFTVLTILNWLRERMGTPELPPELQCDCAARFAEVSTDSLKSGSGEDYRIVSIPVQGVWALRLREPDPKLIGRSFITNIGVRILTDTHIELGVRIDILDRHPSLPEALSAYRPKFIRLLFMTPGLHLSQSTPLLYKEYTALNSKTALNGFMGLAANGNDMLPLVVFTHAEEELPQKGPPDFTRLPPSSSADPWSAIMQQQKIRLPSSDQNCNIPSKGSQYLLRYQSVNNAAKPAKTVPAKTPPQFRSFLPYDTDEFASHTYGFAKVFVLAASLFNDFRMRMSRTGIKPGDILLVEPKAFGGAVHVYEYTAGYGKKAYDSIAESILDTLRCYSKHKPYLFGSVLFVEDAQSMIRELEINGLRQQFSSATTDREVQLLSKLEEETRRSGELLQQNEELRRQLANEYQRGSENLSEKNRTLDAELADAHARIIDLKDKLDSITAGYSESKGIRDSLDAVRMVDQFPQTCLDIALYFRNVFSDRLDFTEQGIATAEKCIIKPSVLWACLYQMATVLCDIHRRNSSDVENEFKARTGLEVAMSEGSQTRRNSKMMNLRKDFYGGREISIEPHLKLAKASKKSGGAYQRIYYCYDAQTRKILIGWVGDHLENHSSLSMR